MFNIAIDGPSGAGKSTIAKILAKKLGITYLDTGAMYRAVGLKAMRQGIAYDDEEKVKEILCTIDIAICYEEGVQKVFLDGEDVSLAIREHQVSKAASDISALQVVRTKLVDMQRQIASQKSVVLDGRDITSVVLPHAKYKFFLTASPEVRAERRFEELKAKGSTLDFNSILDDINKRDYNDSHRANSPLIRTEDSIFVDTSEMTIDEVLAYMSSFIKE